MQAKSIIVIGAGVVGLSCALRLAQRGAKVSVLDKGSCGNAASGTSLGVLTPPNPLAETPFHKLHRQSLELWPDFDAELSELSGIKTQYHNYQSLEIIPSESQLGRAKEEVAYVEKNNLKLLGKKALELISAEQAQQLEPNTVSTEYGAILCAVSATVSVEATLSALKLACLKVGVRIVENCEVQQIEQVQHKVSAVLSAQGRTPCDAVLVSAGSGTPLLSSELQCFAKVNSVRGQAAELSVAEMPIKRIIKWKKGYVVPSGHNSVITGSTTEREPGLDQQPTLDGIMEIFSRAKEAVPSLANSSVKRIWAGLRPAPVDRKPSLGQIPGVEGLFVASGHYKVGFGFAPITAEIIADLILQDSSKHNVSYLSPSAEKRKDVEVK